MYLEKAILTKQELDSLRPFDKGIEERVMQKLRLDWNYHSNSIEGNSLTYGETKSLILHHITAQGKPLRDHFEITGHNDALLCIIDIVNGDRKITEYFIRELHVLILKENYIKKAITSEGEPTQKEIKVGKYKTSPNHVKTVSGELFYFAEPHEVKAKMMDLLDWYNSKIEDKTINPIILAAEFHHKFILIHPFDDGNGRVARILMNFVLMKFGYHPSIIKKENKEEYYKVLRLADGNNIEPFIEFIAESVNESLSLMLNAINGLPFEDENDIDKQFWLLDQKLKGVGDEIKEFKSPKNVLNVIKQTLLPIFNNSNNLNEKFKSYYVSYFSDLSVLFDGDPKITHFKIENLIEELENVKTTNVIKLYLGYDFKDFNRKNVKSFSYNFKIEFIFKQMHYRIDWIKYCDVDTASIIKLVDKHYDEFLTNEEINTICNKIMQHHIEYIEKQISNNKED